MNSIPQQDVAKGIGQREFFLAKPTTLLRLVAKNPSPITRISQLLPDDRNANRGTERGNAFIERSLREYGMGRSILIDKQTLTLQKLDDLEKAAAQLKAFAKRT